MKTKLIAFSVIWLCIIAGSAALQSCKKLFSPLQALSAARNMSGTWSTPNAVKFFYLTDKCGGFVQYAEQMQKQTWTIYALNDNEVSISTNTDYKGPITTYNVCAQQPIPGSYIVAYYMTGKISSSQMDLYVGTEKVGSMSFTTTNLTGTYTRKICDPACSGLNSNGQTLILTKQ
jgi:hypothetical protein